MKKSPARANQWVSKARVSEVQDMKPGGRSYWSSKHSGLAPQSKQLGKFPRAESVAGSRRGAHYVGVPPGGVVPGSGLVQCVTKPLEHSSSPPEAWVI